MHDIGFLRDLALVMMVAGLTTLAFHRLKQPVLLGYILAGVLIGPHTPGVLITDPRTIDDISNLGVVLLMFTLGLEFSVRKMRDLGAGILLATVAEVGVMLLVGYGLGQAFGWGRTDSLFLGAIVSLSSTMVATSTLAEGKLGQLPFARTMIGMLVTEDVFTIIIITLLTAVAVSGTVEADAAFIVIGHLALFVVVGMVLGLLLLPRLVDRVAGYGRDELLLVLALGICFGASLLAATMGFSVALGAFMAGVVVAEARSSARVVHLVEPLRDMFAALFFVAIGMRIDPAMLLKYIVPALIVAAVLIVGKTVMVSFGVFVTGHNARQSLRTGLGMAQIGEFSFVIATLGLSLGAVSAFLYPIAVAVSVVCMAVSPYLLRSSDGVAKGLQVLTPKPLRLLAHGYSDWLQKLKPVHENATIAGLIRRCLWHIGINVVLVVTLFVVGAYINAHHWRWFSNFGIYREVRHAIIWASAFFLSLPMMIAIYRKAEALGMLLAELGIRDGFAGDYTRTVRAVLAQLIPLAALIGLAVLVGAMGSVILPSRGVVILLVVAGVAVALLLWRGLVRVHAGLQASLRDTVFGADEDQSSNNTDK